jgi:hypothetical protein
MSPPREAKAPADTGANAMTQESAAGTRNSNGGGGREDASPPAGDVADATLAALDNALDRLYGTTVRNLAEVGIGPCGQCDRGGRRWVYGWFFLCRKCASSRLHVAVMQP